MSDTVVHGSICMYQKKTHEKDIESVVFSRDEGIIYVKTVSALKGSSLSIPIASTSDYFLASRNIDKHFILKDIKVQKSRENIVIDYDKYVVFSFLSKVISTLGRYNFSELFPLFECAINLIEKSDNPYFILAHTIERLFVTEGISGDYESCPYCEKQYQDDEVIGYSIEHHCSCCNNCANLINVLSPNLRKYLNATQNLPLESVENYPYNNVKRFLSFECFRLKKIIKNMSDEIDVFLKGVSV